MKMFRKSSERGTTAVESALIMGPLVLVLVAFISGGFLFVYTAQNIRDAGAAAVHAYALPTQGSSSALPAQLVIAQNASAQSAIGAYVGSGHFYNWGDVWMRQIANAVGGLVQNMPNTLFMKNPSQPAQRLTVEVQITKVGTPFASQLMRTAVKRYTPVIGSLVPQANVFLPTRGALWPIENPVGKAAISAALPLP